MVGEAVRRTDGESTWRKHKSRRGGEYSSIETLNFGEEERSLKPKTTEGGRQKKIGRREGGLQ